MKFVFVYYTLFLSVYRATEYVANNYQLTGQPHACAIVIVDLCIDLCGTQRCLSAERVLNTQCALLLSRSIAGRDDNNCKLRVNDTRGFGHRDQTEQVFSNESAPTGWSNIEDIQCALSTTHSVS